MDTNTIIAQSVMRNRRAAKNKAYTYQYRCKCDKQSIEWEDFLIERANRIIRWAELQSRLNSLYNT